MPYDDRDDDDLEDLDISLRRRGGDIPNYLTQAILVTLCCCMPFGIVAIINAAQVNGYIAEGNYEAAQQASDQARKWSTIGAFVGLIGWVLYAGGQIMVGMAPRGF